jgi:hypothetical protein
MLKAADRAFGSHRTAGWRKIFTARLSFLSGFPVPLTFVRLPAEDIVGTSRNAKQIPQYILVRGLLCIKATVFRITK